MTISYKNILDKLLVLHGKLLGKQVVDDVLIRAIFISDKKSFKQGLKLTHKILSKNNVKSILNQSIQNRIKYWQNHNGE